jgi:hypothetical protein
MATADELLHSALHGTAIRHAAEQQDLAASIAELPGDGRWQGCHSG